MAEYKKSEYFQALAGQIIEKLPDLGHILDFGVRIAYLESDQKKTSNGKAVFADCEKVKDKNKMFMPYDFIITVYAPNIDGMNENQLKILLWHELLHIGAEVDDMGPKYSIIPHDFEDFGVIVSRFGNWWSAVGAEPEDILDET